jgi:hypothetical protein
MMDEQGLTDKIFSTDISNNAVSTWTSSFHLAKTSYKLDHVQKSKNSKIRSSFSPEQKDDSQNLQQ